ncbi:MAG: fumarylacetoacetate hydrolase family protein [Calditrichaceae bacterium]
MNKIKFKNGTEMVPSKIIGIGLNYVKHIDEMKSIKQKEPVIFLKPNSSLHDISLPIPIPKNNGSVHHEIELAVCIGKQGSIPIPKNNGSVHHEIELAVCIGKQGSNIPVESAEDYISGFGLALDLTLRDIQGKAKSAGLPWAIAKGFDHSCPISSFVEKGMVKDYNNLNIKFMLNGQERQNSSTANMIFKTKLVFARYIFAHSHS